jgi:hypothetical protein
LKPLPQQEQLALEVLQLVLEVLQLALEVLQLVLLRHLQ